MTTCRAKTQDILEKSLDSTLPSKQRDVTKPLISKGPTPRILPEQEVERHDQTSQPLSNQLQPLIFTLHNVGFC